MRQGSIAGIWPSFLMIGLLLHPFSSQSLLSATPTPTPTAKFAVRPTDYTSPRTGISYFVFTLSPGQSFESQVLISNDGDAAGTATVSAVDGLTGTASGIVYADRSVLAQDVGKWIALDETRVTLQPGEKHVVHFHGTVPQTSWIGQHLGGIVVESDTIDTNSSNSKVQIKVRQQSIEAVEIDNPGASVERLESSGIQFGGSNGQQVLTLNLQNTGELFINPTGKVSVIDSSGKTLQDIPIKMNLILPHTSFTYPIALSGQILMPGNYKADITLNYGKTNQILHVVSPFTVTDQTILHTYGNKTGQQYLAASRTPLWVYAVVALAVLLIIGMGFLLISTRRRMRKQMLLATANSQQSASNRTSKRQVFSDTMPDATLPLGDVAPPGTPPQNQRSPDKSRRATSHEEENEMTDSR
jgi:Bacterial protein of unknown function (DUF916)/Protein of unknown function C-terminal (DUF3324)